jgi:hypothetical protein
MTKIQHNITGCNDIVVCQQYVLIGCVDPKRGVPLLDTIVRGVADSEPGQPVFRRTNN